MPHNSEYYPDYEKLYPGIEKRPDILRVLRASDRKMRYMEQQLQTNRFMEDQEKQIAKFLPSRETSLEKLADEKHQQFSTSSPDPEEQLLRSEMIQQLHWAIGRLKKDHLLVLYYRYWKDLSQAEVAELLSLTQQGVCYREQRALHLLKTFLENKKTNKTV